MTLYYPNKGTHKPDGLPARILVKKAHGLSLDACLEAIYGEEELYAIAYFNYAANKYEKHKVRYIRKIANELYNTK